MLAYRHAFHAGNHADVLKHLVFAEVLRHLATKDKPFTVVDTHAGAGGYSLESRYAQKNAEASTGIERLWARDDLPAALARYVGLVSSIPARRRSPTCCCARPTRCNASSCTPPTSASCALTCAIARMPR
jgi:23S rRNA A2030 N6-methylase RlmJ